jgi:hypothetical protein
LASRKGIAVTIGIIGGFVAASFLVYYVPTGPQSDVITFGDAVQRLEFAMDRKQVIIDELQTAFQLWDNGDTDKNTFDASADVAASQIDALIVELRGKQISSEWNDSYVIFIQALDNYKSYIERAKEYVDYKSTGETDPAEDKRRLDAIAEVFDRAESLTRESRNTMP